MLKTKEDILKLASREYKTVGEFRLQSLTDLELADIRVRWAKEEVSYGQIRATMVAASLVDENGERIFSDSESDVISNLPSSVVEPLYIACRELNQMDENEDEEIDDLAKKSEVTDDSK